MYTEETIEHLLQVLETQVDDFWREWVAIQILLPADSSEEVIREKLERTLKTVKSANKFGI